MEYPILAVDRAFTPDRWLNSEDALSLYGRGAVAQSLGPTVMRLRGGTNRVTGLQSILEVGAILVVESESNWLVRDFNYAPFSRNLVFRRDQHLCAYCGDEFHPSVLTLDHVRPECQGGETSWVNVVGACRGCNGRKGGRTPEQAGMELLFLPYKPNRFEHLILAGRNILADQMELLQARVPRHSRLKLAA